MVDIYLCESRSSRMPQRFSRSKEKLARLHSPSGPLVAEKAVSGEKERDSRLSAEIRHDKYIIAGRVVACGEMRRALRG